MAVLVSVLLAGLFGMMCGVSMMALRHVRVVTGFVVVTGIVMLRSYFVMRSGMLVVFGSLVMVLDACVIAHSRSPGLAIEVHILYANRLTFC